MPRRQKMYPEFAVERRSKIPFIYSVQRANHSATPGGNYQVVNWADFLEKFLYGWPVFAVQHIGYYLTLFYALLGLVQFCQGAPGYNHARPCFRKGFSRRQSYPRTSANNYRPAVLKLHC